ncbi:MAG: UDP-N-acetylenolpyruvoylglucosamine reductase [Candidatus Jacksonbacteria bacterium RIFOXYC2_FULL_44_29]|nr:MAG: UDP-N-acetylenolpyruvoylglucosamine reductase [Candidatus Jacksonbacteria bacterium RIFOXYA2_FULL_43_12]OGY77276.1 MAG: UDP-N-acetylenolpyruvoylglucosamine reductase [Candidatus Jacksonbacteria bacterium RIFOXYB2_FULL_44_15]OGY78259.1 MAG: UDP-N-acetylenolpyruvoylglucosamine reductase [Candidatus Jacksonbacteria bacterium RIFOXYC2_FULL_44_29]OGY78918.1 MAG: UDP-N-acetylenolpyruvoylglucosamine reductase [Candidatus Jacksonbacteria bacterium RIFOXYD2_FULL_43_21]HBH46429.1 UDP-N-acetylenol
MAKLNTINNLNIQTNVLLAPYTAFKIGGPADYFIVVKTESELISALNWAIEKKLPYYILSGGSNILVADHGFRGLVIKMALDQYKIVRHQVIADSGVSLQLLAKKSAELGLEGLEFGIGVPGTVGGAVYGNAGAAGQEVKNVVTKVKILRIEKNKLKYASLGRSACRFGYRDSIFKKNKNWIILSAVFNLKKSTPQRCLDKLAQILKDKIANQPLGARSAGSIFINPPGHSAWDLICEVELKGCRIGGVQISEKHANYIIATDNATAEQVVMLIAMIKQRVRDRLKIQLQEEIQYVGF